ncbi:MAG: D-alanyl-D-alanine carboxypeptidase family protein [Actinomycetota bacterium]
MGFSVPSWSDLKRLPRGKVALAAGVVALALLLIVVAVLAMGGSKTPVGRPVDPGKTCVSPPPLVKYRGIVLRESAMRAFRHAENTLEQSGKGIRVEWSYRDCEQQRQACLNICGDPKGCPNLCAEPGSSMHQIGAAIDLRPSSWRDAEVVQALKQEGWCQPLPQSDAGHFSFGQCR